MSYLEAQSPEELHAAVDRKLRTDDAAAYYAEYQVEGAEIVTQVVPERNFVAARENRWLAKIASTYGMTKLDGFDLLDPVYVLEWLGLAQPVALSLADGLPFPPSVGTYFCSHCQDRELAQARLGSHMTTSPKTVSPVRLPFGLRVIEILLCAECIDTLGVEPS